MKISKDYPGTAQHQALLYSIAAHYENDPRILAVSVFGSLGRGDWDSYSDADLDAVVADGVKLDIREEIGRLSASLASAGQQIALMILDGEDACDLVFRSLMELSIRYHPLSNTSPNNVDGFQLIAGRMDRSAVEAAGLANRKPDGQPMDRILDRCIRHALEADSALHRGHIWAAVELLHLMRESIMELYARSRCGKRAYQFFQKEADGAMQTRLGATLPHYSLQSVRDSLARFLDILTRDLAQLSDGQVELSEARLAVLDGIRSRQTDLMLSSGSTGGRGDKS